MSEKSLLNGVSSVLLSMQGEEENTIYFDLKMLNFTTASVAVRDLWQHKDLGTFTGM